MSYSTPSISAYRQKVLTQRTTALVVTHEKMKGSTHDSPGCCVGAANANSLKEIVTSKETERACNMPQKLLPLWKGGIEGG